MKFWKGMQYIGIIVMVGAGMWLYVDYAEKYKSERDVLGERVEWQADSLQVYETWWAESQERNEHFRIRDISGLDSMPVITACTLYVGNVPKPHSDSITIFKFERLNQIANLDSLKAEIYFLRRDSQDFYNNWRECLLHSQELRKQARLSPYDSTVLIDGILYERAAGANTAKNDGVGIPFKGVSDEVD